MIEHWSGSSGTSSPTLLHPATMRAAVLSEFGSPDVLSVAEVASPVRVNSEVLVKVAAAGVNPLDAETRAGTGVAAAIPGSQQRTLPGQTHQVKDEAIVPELVSFFA